MNWGWFLATKQKKTKIAFLYQISDFDIKTALISQVIVRSLIPRVRVQRHKISSVIKPKS